MSTPGGTGGRTGARRGGGQRVTPAGREQARPTAGGTGRTGATRVGRAAGPREETVHRGVRWRRRSDGAIGWFHEEEQRWVRWRPGADAPPRPPGWQQPGVPLASGVARPRWLSGWRLVPVAIFIFVVVIAAVQALRPSGNQVKAEAAASAKLLGHCLAQDGTAGGHPRYSSTAVPCTSPKATVKVIKVIPSTPGSPRCPAATVAVQLAYPGVRYPHIECVQPVHASPRR